MLRSSVIASAGISEEISYTTESSTISSPNIVSSWREKKELKRDAQKFLASQYPKSKQLTDIIVACLWSGFAVRLYCKILYVSIFSFSSLLTLILNITASAIIADFLSGMIHWGCDTWGTLNTPVIGKTLIRSFREHHVDPTAITRHPFPETNGNSFTVTLPLIILLSFFDATPAMSFVSILVLWIAFTNQIHKWAHTYQPPVVVSLLQKYRIILQGKNHNYHHFSPYDRDYCITTGWLNPVFCQLDLWKRMESMITEYTGAKPREDDKLWTQQHIVVEKPNEEVKT